MEFFWLSIQLGMSSSIQRGGLKPPTSNQNEPVDFKSCIKSDGNDDLDDENLVIMMVWIYTP